MALNALVLVPDFFKGAPLEASIFPLDTPEKGQKIMSFLENEANPDTNKAVLLKVVEEAKAKWTGIESFGAVGLCWGGKVC